MTVDDIVKRGYAEMRRAKLHHHFFGNSLLKTAQYLTFFYLQLPHEYKNPLYLSRNITTQAEKDIMALFARRIAERIPVEYITQEAWYLGNKFYVNPHVLVPRSSMNTRFSDFLREIHWENKQVLDLCAGSGCIGITLALLNPNISVDLLDISAKALEVAAVNIQNYDLSARVRCIESDLFDNVQKKYDLIISNPPYVSNSEYNASPDEFKKEPKMALAAGVDGLDIIKRILDQAKSYLNQDGKLIVEVGSSSAKVLKRKYPTVSFTWLKYRKPVENTGMFNAWVNRVFGMDCIFICEAKNLPAIT